MPDFDNFTLEVTREATGRYYVTSPQIRGLLVSKPTRSEAILYAAEAIELLHAGCLVMRTYVDQQMLRTLKYLAANPLEYFFRYPITSIERAISSGLASTSTPRKIFHRRSWHEVVWVTVSPQGEAAIRVNQ